MKLTAITQGDRSVGIFPQEITLDLGPNGPDTMSAGDRAHWKKLFAEFAAESLDATITKVRFDDECSDCGGREHMAGCPRIVADDEEPGLRPGKLDVITASDRPGQSVWLQQNQPAVDSNRVDQPDVLLEGNEYDDRDDPLPKDAILFARLQDDENVATWDDEGITWRMVREHQGTVALFKWKDPEVHGSRCAQRLAPAAECDCGVADRLVQEMDIEAEAEQVMQILDAADAAKEVFNLEERAVSCFVLEDNGTYEQPTYMRPARITDEQFAERVLKDYGKRAFLVVGISDDPDAPTDSIRTLPS